MTIPWQFETNGFRSVIRNVDLDLSGPLSITAEKINTLFPCPLWIAQQRHKHWIKKYSRLQEQFDHVCSSMNFQFGNHGFSYSWRYTTDRNEFSSSLNDKSGCRNDVRSCFQKNLNSVCSIVMAKSVFGSISENVCRNVHSTLLNWPIAWSDGIEYHWMHASVPFVWIHGGLNNGRHISVVLRSVSLPFILSLQNATLYLDNIRSYVSDIVWTYLDTGNVWLLPWPVHSPDLLPIENVWWMVAELLAYHYMPVTTVNELWHLVELTRAMDDMYQSHYDLMFRYGTVVIASGDGFSRY